MATFTNTNKSASPSFSNQSRNSASFSNMNRSDLTTYGELDNSFIGDKGNDYILHGKAIGDWRNDDPISGTFWSEQTRN